MAENLVNGDADNAGTLQTTLLTVNAAGFLEASFESSTDMEGPEMVQVKRKSHHAEIEKRRKSKLNEGINKLIEVLPDRDAKRSKVQILEDTYNLIVELKKKCNELMIQNAPESEVDEIKRLMEENATLKKDKDEWTEFLRSHNINTDIKTHMKAVQSKSKKNSKQEPPSEQLLGGSQNIIIQSPNTAVMGSPNLMTMPTNQMTIPIASGNRLDGGLLQASTNQGGMLLVATSKSGGDSQQGMTLASKQVKAGSNDRPEAEGQSPVPKPIVQATENQTVSAPSQEATGISAITCTHEASNQSSMGQASTTTAESKNTTAVTQVISTPITTPASQNQVLMQSGVGGVRLVQQQQPVQSQSQTVLIQLPGQPGQFIPVRIAQPVNQPQQVILTSQQGVNVVATRGSAIQPKTPVKKKQPPQLKVKNLCPLQPDSRKPNSPIAASQSNVQPIAPNTVTVRLPMNPTPNQQSAVVMNNQGQLILQQPSNTVLSSGVNMQMPVQVVPKPQVTQNIVYIQQNGQLIPVILQQGNQGNVQQSVQQAGVQQTGTILQNPPQQQAIKIQASQNVPNPSIQSAATLQTATHQVSASVPAPAVVSSSTVTIATSQVQVLNTPSIPGSASSTTQASSTSFQPSDLMNPLAIETSGTHSNQGRLQGSSSSGAFAANDILAKATESIFSSQSETSPMQLGDLSSGLNDSQPNHTANQSVIKNTNGLFTNQTTQPGIEIYDLPDDMDTSSSKSKHKKKKKKKSKSKEKEKKKKDKDKEKGKKIAFPLPTVASSDNNADASDGAQEMTTEELMESLMQQTLDTGGIDDRSNAENIMKLPVSTSLSSDIPVSSNGRIQMSSFSAESLVNSGTRDNVNAGQREEGQVSSATILSSESNGQAILNSFNDILSNSMSVSGLPTYIDEEEEMVPTSNSADGHPCVSATVSVSTSSLSIVTSSSNCTQNQPSNSLSLTFPESSERMNSSEQKTPDSTKASTTPTSDSFHSFMSPNSFPSISSLLEQTSNAEREASISSLPTSNQKDDSPTSGFTGTSFQHSWISHHSKASELARGIQPAKSQSPVSLPLGMSLSSTTLTTAASIAASMAVCVSQPVNISPPVTSLHGPNTGNVSKSSPPLNLLSQPWLNSNTAEALPGAESQSELGSSNMRQQQQLVDIIQGLSGPKVSTSPAKAEISPTTSDVLDSLPKSQPTLESLFGLPPFGETRSTSQSASNGDLFSNIESSKSRTTPISQDGFLGLPSYSVQNPSKSTNELDKSRATPNNQDSFLGPPPYSAQTTNKSGIESDKSRATPSSQDSFLGLPSYSAQTTNRSSIESDKSRVTPNSQGSFLGLPPYSAQTTSKSGIESDKSKATPSSQDSFLGLPSYPSQSTSKSSNESDNSRATPNSQDGFLGLPPYSVQTTSSSSAYTMQMSSSSSLYTTQPTSKASPINASSIASSSSGSFLVKTTINPSVSFPMHTVSSASSLPFSIQTTSSSSVSYSIQASSSSSAPYSFQTSSSSSLPFSFQTTSSSSSPFSIQKTSSSNSTLEQNSVFRDTPIDQVKNSSSSSSTKLSNAPPSYSLMNRVTAVVDKYNKERKAPITQNTPKVPDMNNMRSNATNDIFQNVVQQQTKPSSESGSSSSINQSRFLHPKSRALATAAMQESQLVVQESSNNLPMHSNTSATQARQRNGNQKNANHKKLPVKNFSTATLHRTLTANISEEGGPEQEEPDEEPVVEAQTEPVQEAPQQLPFRPMLEPQLPLKQDVPQVPPPEQSTLLPSAKKSKGSKKKQKDKVKVEPPKQTEEELDNVGRRELDKNLVNRFPWLAEANGKGSEKPAGSTAQNPTAFSVQSISQSSSKNSALKAKSGTARPELPQNPPPYPSRTPVSSTEAHNQSLWNPSSFDSVASISSSSGISQKQTAQDQTQRHSHLISSDISNSNRMDTLLSNRQATGKNRPGSYQSSSSANSVQAAVNAAISKASQQALLAKAMASTAAAQDKNRTTTTTKKSSQRPKVGGSSQILRQSDIDDGLDFLNSTSGTPSAAFPTSLSSVNMDMFDNQSGNSSLMSRQADQLTQKTGGKSRAMDKPSRVESSSHSSTLLSSDFANVSQDNFSFPQWNLEPQQTEDRENTRAASHKMQELASPPMQPIQQRGGNNCVSVNFGDTTNLGSGDDLDFSSLPSFSSSNQQQQHTPNDRQTPQNQSYSVPSGRSSVASMEPSPLQASPMNYNVQDTGHMSQMNEMPHSNSSSRGPPSVETPSQQQQRRMTHSPMVQSGHSAQGIKRAATDGHHLNVAKKAHAVMHPGRRAAQQPNLESRQHPSVHSNQQPQVHGNAMTFQTSTAQTQNQPSESTYASGEIQRTMYPAQGSGRIQEGSRSKKRTPNPSDSIFARDPHEVDGTRSTSISLLQDSWFGGGSTRMNTSSTNEAAAAAPTFLPNFSSSQTSQSQSDSVPSSRSSSSLTSNISPSRRLRHSEMPTYLPSHLPGPILPSPPQTKGSRETDIAASFNPMFTPSRAAGIHSIPPNFPVFHEHQPPTGFNISKSNQIPGTVTQPFNFNNIFNDAPQMTSTSHVSDPSALNHGIGLPPAVHLHGNASLPTEDSVIHGNMGQRHAGQHFGLLGQNRPPEVRGQFKMAPMGMTQHFHSPSFMPPY